MATTALVAAAAHCLMTVPAQLGGALAFMPGFAAADFGLPLARATHPAGTLIAAERLTGVQVFNHPPLRRSA